MIARRGPKRVLLVEDEPSFQQTLRKHLQKRGFDVATAHDSESALALLRDGGASEAPDLAILDLHLPRKSGYEVCEMIRGEPALKDLVIVLMGNERSPEARAYAEEAGANGYLTKPFALAELDEQIDALFGEPPRSA